LLGFLPFLMIFYSKAANKPDCFRVVLSRGYFHFLVDLAIFLLQK